MKSENYNLPATQFISKESDSRIERDLRTLELWSSIG